MNIFAQGILNVVSEKNYTPQTLKQIAHILNIENSKRNDFFAGAKQLEEEGHIMFTKKEKVITPKNAGYIVGEYSSSDRGFGFVIPTEDIGGDVFIPARFSFGAMHRDIVISKITESKKDNMKMEGEVVKVIKRNTKTLVGRYEKGRNHGFVVCDNKKYCNDIFVSKGDDFNAQNDDKVIVEITKYGDGRRNPEGKITSVLGQYLSKEANYMGVLMDHNIALSFPQNVLDHADSVPQNVLESDMVGRLDLRNEIIYTIDGADAKDFDDAISIEKKGENYLLGVHIADVSNYVTEGSPLDKEAMKRGTSVYFVDQVVPMLPFALSNGICSLNEGVERLAFTIFMEIEKGGKVVDYTIKKSVIKSCARLIYADVSAVIEGRASADLNEKYAYLSDKFALMDELSKILYKRREKRGSINFDFPEPRILVNEEGEPIDIVRRERGVADKIIEEFMLAANETIAEFVATQEKPLVYRVHESPNEEKTNRFLQVSAMLGYSVKTDGGKLSPMVLQGVLDKIKGKKEERMLSTLMLRSLMKAQYSAENMGHFGLAAKFYCHFTSPIRRYPDLCVHRILGELIEGKMTEKREKELRKFTVEASALSSQMELNAVEAERDIDDLYKCIYMSKFLGEVFEGVISSVMKFGIFVELPNTVEGLVRIEELDDDYYEFVEERFCLLGTRTGKSYGIGDAISVKVARCDISSRDIDFVLE